MYSKFLQRTCFAGQSKKRNNKLGVKRKAIFFFLSFLGNIQLLINSGAKGTESSPVGFSEGIHIYYHTLILLVWKDTLLLLHTVNGLHQVLMVADLEIVGCIVLFVMLKCSVPLIFGNIPACAEISQFNSLAVRLDDPGIVARIGQHVLNFVWKDGDCSVDGWCLVGRSDVDRRRDAATKKVCY